jgi:hypothetical protein
MPAVVRLRLPPKRRSNSPSRKSRHEGFKAQLPQVGQRPADLACPETAI